MYINEIQQEIMLKTTSLIECQKLNGKQEFGTCFFCQTTSQKIILVSNKHVFENSTSATLFITVHNLADNSIIVYPWTFKFGKDILFHPDYDIATLDITNFYYTDFISKNLIPEITLIEESAILTTYDNLNTIQDIVMLGYPGAIINNATNHPITRIGVTATSIKEKYNNLEIFLTDIPTFGGSSGSPIFITNKEGALLLVGINSETFLQHTPVYSKPRLFHKRKLVGYVDIPNDIGIAINSRIIKEMLSNY